MIKQKKTKSAETLRYIPEKTKLLLWGKAAGCCQYDGCNTPLYSDAVTKAEFNIAYIAHIIAASAKGPRGDEILSPQLKKELSNLMLLCDVHHRRVDKDDVAGHPVERLREMKRKHEARVALLTSLTEDKQSHILFYGANIGQHGSPMNFREAGLAMLPDKYPASLHPFELSLKNSAMHDRDASFWLMEQQQLYRQFMTTVKPRLTDGTVQQLSVFGLAPQPLLIALGCMLSDIQRVEVYQRQREPQGWSWQAPPDSFEYVIKEPDIKSAKVALVIALSATVDEARIKQTLGNDVSIWMLTIDTPANDFLKSREQLAKFRPVMRALFDRIKARHGQDADLHLFPVAPVAINVEIGRVWQPKADMTLHLYDQNSQLGGFVMAFTIDKKKPVLENTQAAA